MLRDRSVASLIFEIVNYTLLSIIALLTLLPFVHVIAASFTTNAELATKTFVLIPTRYTLSAYKYIFSTDEVTRSLLVSIGITAVGTFVSMLLSCLMAYGLSRKDLYGRGVILFLVIFTMLFQAGMIPTFLVVKDLGMIDSYWSLIIPGAISAFNLIILKNFFQSLPEGLEESAKIDGCSDFGILFKIVIPLSLPAIATISLFYAVNYWNTYFNAILYLNDASKWPVQVILRQIVVLASGLDFNNSALTDTVPPPDQTVKMAVIVVATVPVLLVYPFLQKYFTKGALLGSIKG
ncbi:MAG: transporter permease [Bacilli bacterium]|nr:transporter permease [Bacilli bacterium]